ncbi:nicotinate-nucleotide--dimethylbenzimidazole phosphoribosyltransferase [Marilutibacter aestuarii]|uniref:Nicotinate-nucleotide--dimethylbenzimidazole phosphoribosyltransferase n=1 Tax=Marilutibacter aestuarii TaxID=1706195 RepID=A0A508AAE3_9GAMM|nr:nicotinate-nucleotide--dimethylbenzimidazole phosphoribosyltransferase [Lysobacter aestuarii]TQD43995.1 nicotinate-nucleotide--dimethylbenzimidazole phosphoribosyltransferase [Lysobacter aestuarii]
MSDIFDPTRPAARVDTGAAEAARLRQARLTKPPGSLGRLEDAAIALAGLQGRPLPTLERVWISVFAADHGVAAEGVSAFPQAVTGEMVRNFAGGGAAISVLARQLGATLDVVHLGSVNDPGAIDGVRRDWIAPMTANFCAGPAMSELQLRTALEAGAASVALARAAGAELFIGGEMGIANTTSATALACALLDAAPAELAGAGTGLDAAGIRHKIRVVERGLQRHAGAATAMERLRCLGGFEIAALSGACIAAAQAGLPVLVDGFIGTAAALAAVQANAGVRDWLLFSHRSREHGHARLLDALQARPLLDLDMRLGEASGAATAVPLLRLACALHAEMATFEQAGVSAS